MRLYFLYILFFLSLTSKAQLMDWGNPQKLISRNFYCKFVGANGGGYYYLRCKKPDFKNDVSIEKYSRSLSLLWSKNINNARAGEVLQDVLLMKNKLLIINAEENYSNGFTELKAAPLSFDGDIGSQFANLFQVKSSAFYNDNNDDRFTIRLNEQKTVFVVCYLLQAEKRQASLNYNLFNETIDNIGSGGYAYTNRTDQFFINDIRLYNYTVYSLVSYSEPNKKNPEDVFLHDLIAINLTSGTFSRVPVVLEGKIQSDLGIYIDTIHQSIQLTGFYSEKKSTSAAGITYSVSSS